MKKHRNKDTCRCSDCEELLPLTAFLPLNRSGWKVTICDACARENMAKWHRSGATIANLDRIKDRGDCKVVAP